MTVTPVRKLCHALVNSTTHFLEITEELKRRKPVLLFVKYSQTPENSNLWKCYTVDMAEMKDEACEIYRRGRYRGVQRPRCGCAPCWWKYLANKTLRVVKRPAKVKSVQKDRRLKDLAPHL